MSGPPVPPASEYFDFLDAGEGRVGLVVADVSGKGFAAALLVASLHASLRSQSPRGGDLASRLQTVNREVRRFSAGEQADDQTMVITRVR